MANNTKGSGRKGGPKPAFRTRTVAEARAIADALPSKISYADKPLSEKQRAFAENVGMHGMTQKAAAFAAGYGVSGVSTVISRLVRMPRVVQYIRDEQEKLAVASSMTKKKVLDGILEAIDMARTQSEPLTMITGWRDIGKMCGFFEPTRHKLEISVQGEVVIQRLQALDDDMLLQLAEGNLGALEGEFSVLP